MMRAQSVAASLLILLLALSLPAVAWAQPRSGRPEGHAPPRAPQQEQPPEPRRDAGPGVLRLLPGDVLTEHSLELPGGQTLAYTATAGTLALYD